MCLLLLPPVSTPRATFPIEFFRGIIIALITALLALGSVVLSFQRGLDYPAALFVALLAVAAFLLFLAWLIAPDARSGLGSLWEKSVLNIGTPFEAWISRLAELAARESSMAALYAAALEDLLGMPWVAGLRSADGALRGRETGHFVHLASGPVDLTLYAERPIGLALRHHARLLLRAAGAALLQRVRAWIRFYPRPVSATRSAEEGPRRSRRQIRQEQLRAPARVPQPRACQRAAPGLDPGRGRPPHPRHHARPAARPVQRHRAAAVAASAQAAVLRSP
jgi:hypothetical protein